MKNLYMTTVGPVGLDMSFSLTQNGTGGGTKHDCTCEETLGCAAANEGRQAARLGASVRPVLLIGDDPLSTVVEQMVRRQFEQPLIVRQLEQTRRSALIGDDCYTLRLGLIDQRLPDSARHVIEGAELTVLAPLHQNDTPFAEQVLDAGRKVILQLSSQQLQDREVANALAKRAWVTIVNQSELVGWTDMEDTVRGIMWLREQGVGNLIVTGRSGVTGFVDGNWLHQRAYETAEVRETIGAGDCFVGTFAMAIAEGQSWQAAIRLGLASAAMHVEGNAAANREALTAVISERSTVPFQPRRRPKRSHRRTVLVAGVVCLVPIVLSIGWLL